MTRAAGLASALCLLCLDFLAPLRAESPTEAYIRKQIKAGQAANLLGLSEAERTLRPGFLENLLGAASGIPRSGIQIVGGIVVEPLDLQSLDATHDVALNQFRFAGPVDISYAHFHGGLSLEGSTFESTLTGYRVTVDQDVFAESTRFDGGCVLNFAAVQGTLSFMNAEFRGKPSFNSVHVGGMGAFAGAVFSGDADFISASFAADFDGTGARFESENGDVTFNSMRVGHVAFFDNAHFSGNADFAHMEIGRNFEARKAEFTNAGRTADFQHMRIGTKFLMHDVSFAGLVMLQDLTANELEFFDVRWPPREKFECEDLTYRRINTTRAGKDDLLDWPELSRYSPSIYVGLAAYLDDHARRGDASQVRLNRQWREGERLNPFRWLLNRLYWAVVGYGERIWWAFLWIAAIVAIGFFTFRRKDGMQLVDKARPDLTYNPFWYSLGLFLPIGDLGQAKCWKPRDDRKWPKHYAQIHVLLGWLFVPVALAAITGLLK